MPKHTSWLTYLLAEFPALKENAANVGKTFIGDAEIDYRGVEPIFASLLLAIFIIYLAGSVRSTYKNLDESVVPEARLTLRTFFEVFFGYFYDLAKDVMGSDNAKRYFPLIGGSAIFIFASNIIGMLPGFPATTASLNVTFGCALLVFLAFNYYGFKENGWDYVKHIAGPVWYMAPLIFVIELISIFVRPLTLSFRLMMNISVDHLLMAVFLGLVALFIPVPLFFLGLLVAVVQTIVFCLLTCIYIGLSTEKAEH